LVCSGGDNRLITLSITVIVQTIACYLLCIFKIVRIGAGPFSIRARRYGPNAHAFGHAFQLIRPVRFDEIFIGDGVTVIVESVAEFLGAFKHIGVIFIAIDTETFTRIPISIAIWVVARITASFIWNTQ